MLKVNLFHSKCSNYQNPESLKEEMAKDPSFYKDCAAILGPNQPSDHDARPDLHGPPVRRGREEDDGEEEDRGEVRAGRRQA